MPRPTSRGSRPTARRVRFATTATVYGEDSAPASAPVRGGPRLTVRSRRPGPSSSSSSSTSAPTTSNATRSSSRASAAPRSRTPSVDSPTLSTSSRPFRSVSFARAAAREPSPAPAPAPVPVPAPVSRLSSRFSSRVPASASSASVPVSSARVPVQRLIHRSGRVPASSASARVPVSDPVSSPLSSRVSSRVSAPSPPPVESSAGAAVDACTSSVSSSVVSRSTSPPAASVRFESATSYRSSRLRTDELVKPSYRPRSPLPDSRPLLTDSDTRRLDDAEKGIRRLREETRNAADDHHRMVRPRPAPEARPRRTPSSIDALAAPRPRNPTPATAQATNRRTTTPSALAVPRPRNPTPATAQAMTRTRDPIKAPAAPSAPVRVPRSRPHAPATAQAEPRSRNPTQSSRTTTRPGEATCSLLKSGTAQTTQNRPSTTTTTTATKPTRVASVVQPARDVGLAEFAKARKAVDDLLARLQSARRKSILKSEGSGRRPPRSVAFNEETQTTIVDRWITRDDVYPEPPKICGSLQGWKTEPLPEPTEDGEELHYTTYWCSVHCSQLTHSHHNRSCGRQCAWNMLARIQQSKLREGSMAGDDLAYLSTAAIFRSFNSMREGMRKRGLDAP